MVSDRHVDLAARQDGAGLTAGDRLLGLHALPGPMRLRNARELAAEETGSACSAFFLPVTTSTTAHDLRVLCESGLLPGPLDSLLAAAGRRRVRLGDGS